MKIMMLASEAEPYAKTGGLGDVVSALSRALAAVGHEVAVVLPLYEATSRVLAKRPRSIVSDDVAIPLGDETRHVRIIRSDADGVSWFFIEDSEYFARPGLYGTSDGDYPDNAARFMTLVRGAFAIAADVFRPAILHCHDWQTGLAPVLIKSGQDSAHPPGSLPTLFTIHNLGYDGMYEREVLAEIGLPDELFSVDGLEFYDKVSFLKGGLLFADRVSTVSEAYSREILTPEYGLGKEGITNLRKDDLTGILNGVDYERWDPSTDELIATKYSVDDLSGKQECKLDLLKEFGLSDADPSRPVLGIVSRVVWQKGLDLVVAVAPEIVKAGGLLTVLGTGETGLEEALKALAKKFPGNVAVRIAHDERLAHKVEAGADIFVMPSRYEPCGLNQMYSLKYGTVPVVRATGGLSDTIQPWDGEARTGNGFRFTGESRDAFLAAIHEAMDLNQDRDAWSVIMRNGMNEDYSWGRSAQRYVDLYEELIQAS